MPSRVNHILERLAREIAPADYRILRIGHRGAAAHAPDNTLLGIRKAASLGADLVEMDVRTTADGQVVLSHPEHSTDVDGHIHFVEQSTLAELQKIDLGQGEHIPTLAQAVELCKQEQLGAYIELKDGRCVPTVVRLVREMEFGGHCIIASFQPDWIAETKAIAPGLLTSVLFSSTHLDPVGFAQSVGANFVHPCWERFEHPASLLTAEWVARVREVDLGIIGWHEERPDVIAALRRVGIDGICSDAPELLR
jgi:glycerophosphoryl diester phosphodiesterase